MALRFQESASFPEHRRNLQAAGGLAGEARAWIQRGDAANDGTGEIRCQGYLGTAKREGFPAARTVRQSALHSQRLVGLQDRTTWDNFWHSDFHAVASRRLGRVERRVGLLKKLFQRQAAPFMAEQEPEAHRNGDRPPGGLHRANAHAFPTPLPSPPPLPRT